ncbi:hypothetical protein, partial [Adlercreutzia equolifaciens]|uniref:hypothetical protein n=1 Tax=Adlercreutzia equolifaciens TaxID=446660 RepID=UPI003AF8479C
VLKQQWSAPYRRGLEGDARTPLNCARSPAPRQRPALAGWRLFAFRIGHSSYESKFRNTGGSPMVLLRIEET